MPESKKFIILPNGMRIQSDIAVKKSEKKQKIDEAPMGFVKSAESLGKLKYRVIAESKPLAKLPSSNIIRRNSDAPSCEIQERIDGDQRNGKSLKHKKTEDKQDPASKKRKKRNSGWTRKKDNTLPRRIEVGCYIAVPPYGRSFKVISKDTTGFFLDIPHKPPYYVTNFYAVEHYFNVFPKLHIETLKKECKSTSEITDILLLNPVEQSIEIIKASGWDPQNLSPLERALVPQILKRPQWMQWKKRIESVFEPNEISITVPKPTIKGIAELVIKPQDFMVKVQNFHCASKGHTLQPIQAEILCRSSNGKIINSILVPAGYCKQCKHYYILSAIYEEYFFSIKDAFCDFVSEENLPEFLQARSLQTREWCLQSDYNKCGYSVSREKNLSDDERIRILEIIIGYKIHSRQEVMSFLNWLIDLNKSNPLKAHAVQKWKLDLLGIANKNGPKVKPRLIKY